VGKYQGESMIDAKMLRHIREQRGMTMGELGRAIGYDTAYIWKYEHGRLTEMNTKTLVRLADVLDCTTDELVGRKRLHTVAV
jgi:transcriptional regulator with XRE-family HTH domain